MQVDQIKSVSIVVKPDNAEALVAAHGLSKWLSERDISVAGEPLIASDISTSSEPVDSDLVVVLGGDGTMIAAARLIGDGEPLVLGINYGRQSQQSRNKMTADQIINDVDSIDRYANAFRTRA